MLEPSIENFDQEFIDNWHSRLEEFSLTLMSHIVTCYSKTIKEPRDKIGQTDPIFKTKFEKANYEEIEKTIENCNKDISTSV